MSQTFVPITGQGSGNIFDVGSKWGAQTSEKVRQALNVLAYLAGHFDLGGDERPILSSSFTTVNGGRSFSLDGDNVGGLTLEAVVFYYTTDVATSVQVRVRNTSDSSTAGTGSVSTATTVTREVIGITMASGVKDYELQVTGSDAANGVVAWGYLRMRAVP